MSVGEPAMAGVRAADEPRREHPILGAISHFSRFSGLAVGQLYLICAAITLYEVVMRYFFNAPTQWAFEMVMTLCATAWLLSVGYITVNKSHIGITVFYLMAPERARWWLDLLAMVVAFVATYLLAEAALEPALQALDIVETTGSAYNAPGPTILKTMLVIGAAMYAAQTAVNLIRHVGSRTAKLVVAIVAGVCAVRLLALTLEHHVGPNLLQMLIDVVFAPLAPLGQVGSAIDVRSIDVGVITIGIVAALLVLMMTGMPLGVVTLTVSLSTAVLFFGPQGLYLVATNVYGLLEKYPLVAVPLFVFMGSILERSGIARDLFDAMSIFAGNLRGGVAVQTTVVAVVLAAMTGIMGGEIVMLGLVALPQMLRLGYDRKLAIGTICAAGSLATLIPPSIVMIVYGLAAQVAIGDLFLAGAVPGLMLALFYIAYILVRCRLDPSLAPTAAEILAGGERERFSLHRAVAVGMAVLLIAAVMGSIYAGIASVTEAAGVGVAGAMLVAALRLKFDWTMIQGALRQTMGTVGTIIWLVLGAVSLVGIYNVIGGNRFMQGLFTGLDVHPMLVILLMMAVLLVLGTFMEWIAIVFITVPIFAPVVIQLAPELGLEPAWAAVWFGVLFVINMQIYFLSPPFGPACFWLKSVAPKDVQLSEIFVAVLPFIALQIVGLVLVMLFPQVALFLPQALSGG